MKPPYMRPASVARFDLPRVGPLVSDGYVVIRPDRCPDLSVPPAIGWWKWQRQEWKPAEVATPLSAFAQTVRRQVVPNARARGALAEATDWVISDDYERRILAVDGRPVPVDAATWDRWVAYLGKTFGAGRWQATQAGRNKPVTFWAGRSWVGVLLPVHDRVIPSPPPVLTINEGEETPRHA